jgi:hypothetical protein
MADASDVCNGLKALFAQTLYPNGTGSSSITGLAYKYYVGWPISATLDADLDALSKGTGGAVNISIFPNNVERNVSKISTGWQTLSAPNPTLTLNVSGQAVTIGGIVSSPQNVTLMIGGKPYVYAVQSNDSLSSIATGVSALITGSTSSGAVITLPSNANLQAARVGASGVSIQEVGRQAKRFQIVIWADTPAHRDLTASAIDVALKAARRLTLTDGTVASLTYVNTFFDDMLQKARVFRRDLIYEIDFATTQSLAATQVTQIQNNINASLDADSTPQLIATVYE